MKRSFYLFPLMAATALSLSLGACDDKKDQDQAAADQTTMGAPADTTAVTGAATDTTSATGSSATAAGQVSAMTATAYATSEGATTGAVFLSLQNSGTQATKLTGGTTDVASSVELHESVMDPSNGTAQMRKVDGIEIQPGQTVELRPDGYHIMLIGLNKTLVEGETFNVTLQFDNAPEAVVPVTITAAGGNASAGTMSDATSSSSSMTTDTTTMDSATGATTGTTTDTTSGMPTDTGTESSTTSPGMGGSATGTSGMGTGTSANPAATEADSATGQ